MRSSVPEKIQSIIHEIEERGCASITRLTVLKPWFKMPGRMTAFAVWVAGQAVSRKGKSGKAVAELFRETRALLRGVDKARPRIDRKKAEPLLRRVREYQDEYDYQRWGPVRIIKNSNLLLIETSLEICLHYEDYPALGYKLAADYCRHYDSRYPEALCGPSKGRLMEIVRFMSHYERDEDSE